MRKYIPIPISAIMDPNLTDAEKTLLFKMIANFGTAIINPGEPTMKTLDVSRRTFYRLIDNLLKRRYLQRNGDASGYKISVSMLAQNSVKNGTDCVNNGTDECQKWHSEREEERSKEEDKEKHNLDSIYIYNKEFKENDKEKEIQKKEKADGSTDEELPKRRVKPFVKPTVEEVQAYCRERRSTVRAQAFWDWYESKGWMVGKNHMKDWKAAVRTWEQKDKASGRRTVPAENMPPSEDDYPF